MSGIWEVILISLIVLVLVLFLKSVGRATYGVASVGALPLGFQVKLELFVVSIFLLASMLQRHLMSPPRPVVLLGLLLFERFGPLRCLLPMLLPFLIF